METKVYEITFHDGRIYRIICENSTQCRKVENDFFQNQDKFKSLEAIVCGLHTSKQWKQIIKTL